MADYPTEKELEKIKTWGFDFKKENILSFVEYIKSIWHFSKWGFKLSGKNILRLELHTGGWSGNEDIINVLMNTDFWLFYWEKSFRGGHYYFRIKLY